MTHRLFPSVLLVSSLALFGAGCSWFTKQPASPSPVTPMPSEQTSSTDALTPVTELPPAAHSSTFKTETVSRKTDRMDINLSYPLLQDSYPAETIATFNAAVSSSVSGFLRDFEANAAKSNAALSTMSLDARVVLRSPELIVVVGEGDTFTGGTQPRPFYIEVLFDVKNNKALRVQDLFTDPDQALRVISDRSISKLTMLNNVSTFTDTKKIAAGAGLTWGNFAFLHPVRTGLTIIFPPSQIADYEAGVRAIHFRYSEISSILKPRFKTVVSDPSTWETYTDDVGSFHFKLPSDFAHYSGQYVDYSVGVNVIPVSDPMIKDACLITTPDGQTASVKELQRVNGVGFCHSVAQDQGMSQVYRTDAYTTVSGTQAIVFQFTSHYLADPRVIGGCDKLLASEEICQTFDEKKDTAIFSQIIDTFSFTSSSAR